MYKTEYLHFLFLLRFVFVLCVSVIFIFIFSSFFSNRLVPHCRWFFYFRFSSPLSSSILFQPHFSTSLLTSQPLLFASTLLLFFYFCSAENYLPLSVFIFYLLYLSLNLFLIYFFLIFSYCYYYYLLLGIFFRLLPCHFAILLNSVLHSSTASEARLYLY